MNLDNPYLTPASLETQSTLRKESVTVTRILISPILLKAEDFLCDLCGSKERKRLGERQIFFLSFEHSLLNTMPYALCYLDPMTQ